MAQTRTKKAAGGSKAKPRAAAKPRTASARGAAPKGPLTLSIDIGGTGLKMMVLDAGGKAITERARVATPHPATPAAVLRALGGLIRKQPPFDRVSVGFPGVVTDGVVRTAPNLDKRFEGFDLARALARVARKPVRVCNDADVQGFGAIRGRGLEMVITLGTGMGSGLYVDGALVPNLELAHHLYSNGKTYEEFVGKEAFESAGKKRWRRRVRRVVQHLEPVFNYQKLYIGGGNAKHLRAEDLPPNAKIVSNEAGVLGGIALWR
jgi:polyphosphate glucokinase